MNVVLYQGQKESGERYSCCWLPAKAQLLTAGCCITGEWASTKPPLAKAEISFFQKFFRKALSCHPGDCLYLQNILWATLPGHYELVGITFEEIIWLLQVNSRFVYSHSFASSWFDSFLYKVPAKTLQRAQEEGFWQWWRHRRGQRYFLFFMGKAIV